MISQDEKDSKNKAVDEKQVNIEDKVQAKIIRRFTFAKLVAASGILLSILGVLYQRGIYHAVGMGNLEINTTIHEVLYYGYEAIVFFAGLVASNIRGLFLEAYKDFGFLSIYFFILGLVVVFIIKKSLKPKKERSFNFIGKFKEHIGSRLFYFTGGVTGVFVGNSFIGVIVILFIMVTVFPALPGVLAMQVGKMYIKDMMKNTPYCVSYDDNKAFKEAIDKYGDIITTCTTITIRDKTFQGKLVLGNKEGYLIALNNAFVYFSKDGNQCYYTYFEKKSVIEEKLDKPEKYEFPQNIELERVCKKSKVIK